MAKDTFKPSAPTIEFFRDGEIIRARKFGKIIDDTQAGLDNLELAVGDLYNRGLAFEEDQLFQNSIGRAVGSMDQLTLQPIKKFNAFVGTKSSLLQGLIRWPFAGQVAQDAGNASLNLIPAVQQRNKVGVGCTRDTGYKCEAGYQSIYNREKNLLVNGFLGMAISGWTTSNATLSGVFCQLNTATRYNLFDWSESFENWIITGPGVTAVRASGFYDPFGQSATYLLAPSQEVDAELFIAELPTTSLTSRDWTFSIWAACSGERDITLSHSGVIATSGIDGHLEGAAVTIDGDSQNHFGLHLSGVDWKRYWVHWNFASTVNADVLEARINLNTSGLIDTTPIYIFGAQLEPTDFPTDYQRTVGAAISGFVGMSSVSQSISVVPGHVYLATLEGAAAGNLTVRIDDTPILTLVAASGYATFTPTSPIIEVKVEASGATNTVNTVTLVRVDPANPCHAMNCPGFSAYNHTRAYRAVLPTLTISGHQYFGNRLKLPDDFQAALQDELPGNILGVFDHELNHAVPDPIVNWRLANWPIGGLAFPGLLTDPDFLTDWTTSGSLGWPTIFAPLDNGVVSGLYRDFYFTGEFLDLAEHDQWALIFDGNSANGASDWGNPPGAPSASPLGTSGTSQMTLETWFFAESGSTQAGSEGYNWMYSWGDTTAGGFNGHAYGLLINKTTGKVGFRAHQPFWGTMQPGIVESAYSHSGIKQCNDGQWHHLRVVLNCQTVGGGNTNPLLGTWAWCWVDGNLESSGIFFNGGDGHFNQFVPNAADGAGKYYGDTIGGPSLGGDAFSGLIKSVWLRSGFNGMITGSGPGVPVSSFTPAEVFEVDANTIALWKIEEASGNFSVDEGTGGHDLSGTIGGTGSSFIYHWSGTPAASGGGSISNIMSNDFDTGYTYKARTPVNEINPSGWVLSYAASFATGETGSGIYFFNHAGDQYQAFLREPIPGAHFESGIGHVGGLAGCTGDAGGPGLTDGTRAYLLLNKDKIYTISMRIWHSGGSTSKDLKFGLIAENARSYGPCFGNTPYYGFIATGELDGDTTISGTSWTLNGANDNITFKKIPNDYTWKTYKIIVDTAGVGASVPEPFYATFKLDGTGTGTSSDFYIDDFSVDTEVAIPAGRQPVDVLVMSSSGLEEGVTGTFSLDPNKIYTVVYKIRGNSEPSGVFDRFELLSGAAQVDVLNVSEWQDMNAGDIVTDYFTVSGSEMPGESTWSEFISPWWQIRRRIRSVGSQRALMAITVGVLSGSSQIRLDSFNVERVSAASTIFEYIGAPVLGLVWEGSADHVIEENLWSWSERPDFLDDNDYDSLLLEQPDPSGNPTAFKISKGGGTQIGKLAIPITEFHDPTITLQFAARCNIVDSGNLPFAFFGQDTTYQPTFEVSNDWQEFAFTFNGVDRTSETPLNITIGTPNDELELAWITLHHGSGIVPYHKTEALMIKRYRHALHVDATMLSGWDTSYGLISTVPIQTLLTQDSDGSILVGDTAYPNFVNFPTSGVVRIVGQEIAYRGLVESSGFFVNLVPGWRGTPIHPELLLAGKKVTYIQLPQHVERIEDDPLIYFRDLLPVPDGDWANRLNLQLYNTQIANMDRFALTASSIPLTRVVGNLMTSFVQHVSEHMRHYRRDMICASIVDPSTYAGFDDIEIRLSLVQAEINELDEEAQLNIFAFGMMRQNTKEVTINWGDGHEDVLTVADDFFDGISHTYDLGPITSSRIYTINVVVTDLDLQVSRRANIQIIVDPAIKGSQTVRAVIRIQPTDTQQARSFISV